MKVGTGLKTKVHSDSQNIKPQALQIMTADIQRKPHFFF